jgi:hypothetical protein
MKGRPTATPWAFGEDDFKLASFFGGIYDALLDSPAR